VPGKERPFYWTPPFSAGCKIFHLKKATAYIGKISMKTSLRVTLRAARNAIPQQYRLYAEQQIVKQIISHPIFFRSKDIAFYMANDGEINVFNLLEKTLALGKRIYLPKLHPTRQQELLFLPYTLQSPLINNRYDIPEPEITHSRIRPVWSLDLLFMPLVGFDRFGNRLGMGSGYYDKTLSRILTQPQLPRPKLVGCAFDIQETDKLPHDLWDIPLDFILTEHRLIEVM